MSSSKSSGPVQFSFLDPIKVDRKLTVDDMIGHLSDDLPSEFLDAERKNAERQLFKLSGGKRSRGSNQKSIKIYRLSDADADDMFMLQTYYGNGLDSIPKKLTAFSEFCEQIGYVKYRGFGKKAGVITNLLVNRSLEEIISMSSDRGYGVYLRDVRNLDGLGEELDVGFNIDAWYKNGMSDDVLLAYKKSNRHDISEFHGGKFAKKEDVISIHYKPVEDFTDVDLKSRVYVLKKPSEYQDVKEGKGGMHSTCPVVIGVNGSKGCLAGMHADGRYNPCGRCTYCYAVSDNGSNFLLNYFEMNEKEFIEKFKKRAYELGIERESGPIHVRLGQNVEMFVPEVLRGFSGFVNNLPIILNGVINLRKEGYDVRCAMPTKTLEFEEEMVGLFRDANVTLLSSRGYQLLEKGVVGLGFDNKVRDEHILKYGMEGIPSAIFAMTDFTRPISDSQTEFKEALEFHFKHSEYVKFLALEARVMNKSDAEIIAGVPWDMMGGQVAIGNDNYIVGGGWKRDGRNKRVPKTVHSDFIDLVGNNRGDVRMCAVHSDNCRKCGKCFMDGYDNPIKGSSLSMNLYDVGAK